MPTRSVTAAVRGVSAAAAILTLCFALSVDGAADPYTANLEHDSPELPTEVWQTPVDLSQGDVVVFSPRGATVGVAGYSPFEGQVRFESEEELRRWGGALVAEGEAQPPQIVTLPDGAAALFDASAPGAVSERRYTLRLLRTGQNDRAGSFESSTPTFHLCALVRFEPAAAPENGLPAYSTVLRMLSGADERISLGMTGDGALRLKLLDAGEWESQAPMTPGAWHEIEARYDAAEAGAPAALGDLSIKVDGVEVSEFRKVGHGIDAPITAFTLGAAAPEEAPGGLAHVRWVRWSHRADAPVGYDADLITANVRDVSATEARIVTVQNPAAYGWADAESFVLFGPEPWPGDGSPLLRATAPVPLLAEDGFAAVHALDGLAPGALCAYRVVVRAAGQPQTEVVSDVYSFRTLPDEPGVIRFGWMSCHEQSGQSHPFDVYTALTDLGVDFIANVGDFHYNDSQPAVPYPATRFEIMNSVRSTLQDLSYAAAARTIPQFIMLDDHDVWANNATDAWANSYVSLADHGGATQSFIWHEGLAAWEAYFRRAMLNTGPDQATYRTWETAQTLFVMLDTRSHQRRSAQSMLGMPQREWLLGVLAAATKPNLVILSPSVWGDVQDFRDNWEGGGHHTAFHAERAMIEQAIDGSPAIQRAIVLSGDRHCSLIHTRLDSPKMLFEACAGPASNNVFAQYNATDAALPGVVFCSTDGAQFPPVQQPPGYAHMAGRVVIDEVAGTITVQIVSGEDGRVMFTFNPDDPPAPVTGDANGDGLVDFADLNIVLGQWNTDGENLAGDLNGDGHVDFADLNVVLSHFNSGG